MRIVNHPLQALEIMDDKRPAARFNNTYLFQPADFPRYGLTVRTDAAGNFGVCGRRVNLIRFALIV